MRSQIATSSFKKDIVMSEIKSEKAVDLAVIKSESEIRRMIYIVRNQQVMLDSDLASLYHVETKRLNERVKRNQNRFPDSFCFQLTRDEFENLRSQFATSSEFGGRRYLPYVFTESGIAMLSAVLNTDVAVEVSVRIMNSFVEMRRFIASNAALFERISAVELKQLEYQKQRLMRSSIRFLNILMIMPNQSRKYSLMGRFMMHLSF